MQGIEIIQEVFVLALLAVFITNRLDNKHCLLGSLLPSLPVAVIPMDCYCSPGGS